MGQGQVNLTDRGLQRHRILFVREMDEAELRRAREGEPSIDRIEIVRVLHGSRDIEALFDDTKAGTGSP